MWCRWATETGAHRLRRGACGGGAMSIWAKKKHQEALGDSGPMLLCSDARGIRAKNLYAIACKVRKPLCWAILFGRALVDPGMVAE